MSEEINEELPEDYQSRVSEGSDFRNVVAWVSDLPPLPQIAVQALALVESEDASASELTKVLSNDMALAARVLKIANSAMFSRGREITTLDQAVMMIGFRTLKGAIVAATLRQKRKTGTLEKKIWQNSVATAICAHIICHRLKKPYADEAFLVGLLHDLGKLVLIDRIPGEYLAVVTAVGNGRSFMDLETEILGYAHPLIGALVAKKWNFSPDLCEVILHSHDPIGFPFENITDEKTVLVQLANCISYQLGYGQEGQYEGIEERSATLAEQLGMDEEMLGKIVEETKEAYDEQSMVYG